MHRAMTVLDQDHTDQLAHRLQMANTAIEASVQLLHQGKEGQALDTLLEAAMLNLSEQAHVDERSMLYRQWLELEPPRQEFLSFAHKKRKASLI